MTQFLYAAKTLTLASGIPGSDECEKNVARALYRTGGGYCCEPCLDLALDEDGHMKRVGGCR